MIYHVLDRQFNSLTMIDTEADDGIVVENDIHKPALINGTLLNTLTMDIYKNTGPLINDNDKNSPNETSLIREGNYIAFVDENNNTICVYIRAIENENEQIRPISCVDIGVELRNGSASVFQSEREQYIDYYVNRELYDTGWQIGVNELGTDIKRLVDTSSDETPLARLQKVCSVFNCEMTFTVDFQNTKVKKMLVNIYRKIGNNKTNKILYSGVDVITMQKSVDIDNVITAIRDTNQGFNNLDIGDGRFFTRVGESIVYDTVANSLYGRGITATEKLRGWNIGNYTSSNSSAIDNYNEAVAILKERSQPTFSAEVDMLFNDGDFDIGDWLTFVDEEYNPPLRLKARVLSKELNRSNPSENKAEIGNYQLLESLISDDLITKQKQMTKPNSTYIVKLVPDNGTSFTTGEPKTTTITAYIYKDGQDITNSVDKADIQWFKVDKEGNRDTEWENRFNGISNVVSINTEDVTETASIKCVLTIFDNFYVQATYFINGLKEVARKVVRLQSDDTVTSIHISDTHYATDSFARYDLENYSRSNNHIKNVVELTNFIDVDYVVLNGDTHDGSTANKNIAISNYREAISTLGYANCPFFVTWGNHCNNNWGDSRLNTVYKEVKTYLPTTPIKAYHGRMSQVIKNNEMYDIATKPSTVFNVVENELDKLGYYYYDVPNKKQRVIILNAQDVPQILDDDGYAKYININVSGYRQKQITWFYNTLKSTPLDVTVSIYQHYPFGKRYGNLDYYPYNFEMIDGIIDSFVTGGKYSKTYNANTDFQASISTDFLDQKGKLAFLAHGHTHADRITKDSNGIVNYSIGCSVSRPKKDQGDRPLGQLEEDLWDVVVLNTKTRHVDLIRFGAGANRSFDY